MWRRFVAPLLDILTVGYGCGYLLALVAGQTSGHAFNLKGAPAVLWLALLFLYFLIGWRYAGGTLWDRLLGVSRPQPAQRRADERPRAGAWRRGLAFAIDGLIVTVVLQLIVAALFAMTSGRVQMYGDVRLTTCTVQSPAPPPAPTGTVPLPGGTVQPVPGGTVVRECKISLFGLPVAKRREIAPAGENRAAISVELIDSDGRPLELWPLDWLALLALMIYVLVMEARTGATLGSRAAGIRVVDTASASAGVAWSKLARRYGAMLLGLSPIIAVPLGVAMLSSGGLAAALRPLALRETALDVFSPGTALRYTPIWADLLTWSFPAAVPALLSDALALVMAYWVLFLLVQVVRKEDPLYDTMAGTAVVRVEKSAASTRHS